MIGDIEKLLGVQPFEPFYAVTSAGMRYFVASPEHAGFNPGRSRVFIYFDDDSHVSISGLHVAAIEHDAAPSSQPA